MNIPIDMSVFVEQDFDCEVATATKAWVVAKILKIESVHDIDYARAFRGKALGHYPFFRPRLNHWHFNDGSMRLPDGLVVNILSRANHLDEKVITDHMDKGIFSYTPDLGQHSADMANPIAVLVLGVTAEYGAQLGMEVVEI